MEIYSYLQIILALLFAPLLIGIINRTKALFAGRKGQPLFQPYFEIIKLFQKDYVYSDTTTPIFKFGTVIILAVTLSLTVFIPVGCFSAPFSFSGDFILIAYLFGLSRFFIMVSALDTGSSFEAMGASREGQYAVLAEPATFLSIIVIAFQTKSF